MGPDPQVTPSPGANVGGRQAAVNGAERLREAAALMRERAEAATPGVWGVVGPDRNLITPGPVSSAAHIGCQEAVDATHVASWHPTVAIAVADWLESEARDRNGGLHEGAIPSAALAVADAYLGTTS